MHTLPTPLQTVQQSSHPVEISVSRQCFSVSWLPKRLSPSSSARSFLRPPVFSQNYELKKNAGEDSVQESLSQRDITRHLLESLYVIVAAATAVCTEAVATV